MFYKFGLDGQTISLQFLRHYKPNCALSNCLFINHMNYSAWLSCRNTVLGETAMAFCIL